MDVFNTALFGIGPFAALLAAIFFCTPLPTITLNPQDLLRHRRYSIYSYTHVVLFSSAVIALPTSFPDSLDGVIRRHVAFR